MQALITRPIEDAEPLAAALAARGIAPVVEPLLAIRPLAGAIGDGLPALDGAQAVLFTSANGARAFARATARRDLPVFAVGDATAQVASALGFGAVASAAGTIDDLAALVAARLHPGRGALIHAAGRAVAGDLAGRLEAAGFTLRRAVLYSADPVASLSAGTAAALRGLHIDFAFFFSPRTAAHFVTLARAAKVDEACRHVATFCLSPAVAAELSSLAWARVVIAAVPEQRALLAAFDGFLSGSPAAPDTAEGWKTI
jgi:uroporphyrinogen-III synthase